MNLPPDADAMKNLTAKLTAARDGATVTLPPGLLPIRSPIVLTKSLRVRGAPDGSTLLDASGVSGVFILLGTGCTYRFETLTFSGGASRQGGIIASPNRNTLDIEGCRFVANKTETGGGALLLHHTRAHLRRCIFEKNQSTCGGALGLGPESDVLLDRCVLFDNEADAGGAIFVDDTAALEIRSSTFLMNRARQPECGNAIFAFGNREFGPSAFIANSVFAGRGALSSDPGGRGTIFVTHSAIPEDIFPRTGFTDVGGNTIGPADLVDQGGGAWTLAHGSPAIGKADLARIEAGAVDLLGNPMIQDHRASPGAVAVF